MIYNDLAPYNPSHFIYYFTLHLFLCRHLGSLLVLKRANQSSSQVVWVPKTSPRYSDTVGLTEPRLSMQSYSPPWFITVRGHEAKSAKGNVSWGEQVQVSKSPLQDVLNSPSDNLWQHIWNIGYQGSSSETWYPWFLLGVSHASVFCLARTKTPDSQKETINCGHSESFLSGNGENSSQIQFARN